MTKLKLLILLAVAAVTQTSFGMLQSPETTLELIKPEIESRVQRAVDDLIPLSMHAHYLTEYRFEVGLGKYAYDQFADFGGTVSGTVLLMNKYYPFTCSVSSRVSIVGFAMQPPENIILQEQGANEPQLIGRIKQKCRLLK